MRAPGSFPRRLGKRETTAGTCRARQRRVVTSTRDWHATRTAARSMGRMPRSIPVIVGALGLAAAAAWLLWQPATQEPGLLDISGRIEGDQAAVGAKVGGRIVRLPAHEGAKLEAGDLIAELASEQAQAHLAHAQHVEHEAREQLTQARARVSTAERQLEAARTAVQLGQRVSRARIGEAEAAVGSARARLQQAEADLQRVARDHVRAQELFARDLIAASQLDQARAADGVARGAVAAAREQITQAEEKLELARASRVEVSLREREMEAAGERVREAQAAVEAARAAIQTAAASRAVAQADAAETRIVAPFAGTVLRRLVEPGEVVAPGTPLVTLVDLARLHAKVYVAEADLGKVKLGEAARVWTDAFPGRAFTARVVEIAQQAEFTPRDVHTKDERVKLVFAVKLAIDNPAGVLKPGMPVDGLIRWDAGARWPDDAR